MTARIWLAILGAPIIAAAVYAWLTLVWLAPITTGEAPTVLMLLASGAVVGLIFELAVILPLLLALRHWRKVGAATFVLVASAAWFAACFLLMLLLGLGVAGASATAVAMLLPGFTLVLGFWFLGGRAGA